MNSRWFAWKGGSEPAFADRLVEVRTRDGFFDGGIASKVEAFWNYGPDSTDSHDVLTYRYVE